MTQAASITREQWGAILKGALAQFQTLLGSYKLTEPVKTFQLLLRFADQVSPLEPDASKVAAAVYTQVEAHLYDRTSVGMQRQLEGRPPQPSDFVIQWVPGCEPRALKKFFPKPQASWIDEVDAREKEQEQHAEQIKRREEQERARKQCPSVIAEFQPVHRGRVDHAAIQRVTSVLQQYLDRYEAQHAADLAKYEADKTFTAWSVNWCSVLEKMREYADKEYSKVEARTPEAERV